MAMDKQRRKHSGEFKAQVALEAVRGVKTMSEMASCYQIHPVTISNWKKELLHKLPGIFVEEKAGKKTDPERESARLERKIGQLTMEVKWLEKKCKQLGIPVNE
jgi:transposase-like protein